MSREDLLRGLPRPAFAAASPLADFLGLVADFLDLFGIQFPRAQRPLGPGDRDCAGVDVALRFASRNAAEITRFTTSEREMLENRVVAFPVEIIRTRDGDLVAPARFLRTRAKVPLSSRPIRRE